MPLLPGLMFYFICMSVFSVYMHVCVPWMLEEDVRSLRTRIVQLIVSYYVGAGEPNSGPLQEKSS